MHVVEEPGGAELAAFAMPPSADDVVAPSMVTLPNTALAGPGKGQVLRTNTLAVYILVTSTRLYSLHCCIHSHHILAH